MQTDHESGGRELAFLGQLTRATSRRTFLKWSGITIGVAAVGCSSDKTVGPGASVSLGTGDTAVLNYAYVLEQLEAAFYVKVVSSFYSGITAAEQQILTDVRDHEVIHRDFFKAALAANAVATLQFDFSSVTFSDRTSVLTTAKTFEDLGVSAYNGAGPLIQDANYLLAAGKIVSVEARHAAVIRDLLAPKSPSAGFAGDDVITANGLDGAKVPSAVLAAAGTYVTATIDASNLP